MLYRFLNKKEQKPVKLAGNTLDMYSYDDIPSVKPDPLNGWTYGANKDRNYSVGGNSVTEIDINDIDKKISYSINPMIIKED